MAQQVWPTYCRKCGQELETVFVGEVRYDAWNGRAQRQTQLECPRKQSKRPFLFVPPMKHDSWETGKWEYV